MILWSCYYHFWKSVYFESYCVFFFLLSRNQSILFQLNSFFLLVDCLPYLQSAPYQLATYLQKTDSNSKCPWILCLTVGSLQWVQPVCKKPGDWRSETPLKLYFALIGQNPKQRLVAPPATILSLNTPRKLVCGLRTGCC